MSEMQKIVAKLNGSIQILELPSPDTEIIPGIVWGHHTHLFTPACWKTLLWFEKYNSAIETHRLGKNLTEEIAACLLGGYGIPSEVGLAAFYRLKELGIFRSATSEDEIYKHLKEPIVIGKKQIKYRFARQKSRYLCSALEKLSREKPPEGDAIQLRSWLMDFAGIGWKTASWITRNWLGSDQVAIIDIHIHRAGLLMKIYNHKQNPANHYSEMEESFLNLASGMSVRASQLDALIWQEMKSAGNMVLRHIRNVVH